MELFHTSPSENISINTNGRFGEFLFFSSEIYSMGSYKAAYRIDLDDGAIIEAGSLFYQDGAEKLAGLVEQVARMVGCDDDTAEELISQRADVHSLDVDAEDAGDMSWDIQAITAKAAKLLGFRGVSMPDEQGTCYMIDMLGREGDLERI